MSNNNELKPCPFCGGEADIIEDSFCYGVECFNCKANSTYFSNAKDAIAAWNRRNYSEKQDSSKELMDFVKFCRYASEG